MKRNIAEEITDRILEDLEKGVTPWEKPWKQGQGLPLPVNTSTGKALPGNQCFCLWDEAERKGYSTPSWVTFNQAKGLKGNVRKGEKGTRRCFLQAPCQDHESLNLEDEVFWRNRPFGFFAPTRFSTWTKWKGLTS